MKAYHLSSINLHQIVIHSRIVRYGMLEPGSKVGVDTPGDMRVLLNKTSHHYSHSLLGRNNDRVIFSVN